MEQAVSSATNRQKLAKKILICRFIIVFTHPVTGPFHKLDKSSKTHILQMNMQPLNTIVNLH